ncbi:MAG TPA: glutathione S-transferase N-terminal domain-containing protein [Solirubrobacteraceae bacterium]|nr:glutathione S-transferase N-terminal domain-containing protein [Solirubrobacteraceae bacterium]
MSLRLYVVPASHPCAAVESALRMKGFEYQLTELPPGIHAAHQRLRFGKRTVPSLKADGRKISGSRAIMRWLEEQRPEPALWPGDPEVERAEAWGDEVLQPVARRVVWWSLRKRPDAMPSFLAKSKLPVPAWAARLSGPVTAMVEFRLNSVTEDAVRADVEALPQHLQRVSEWIDAGVVGGEAPNAADLQIGSSLALMRTVGDLAPLIDGSRAGELAKRWFPDYPGSIPPGTLS